MPSFLLIVKAVYTVPQAKQLKCFELAVEAASEDDAIRQFWAGAAVILEQHGLPLNTTRISLSCSEILDVSRW